MRQSLMMGARPRFSAKHEFPTVPLGVGAWRIEPENRVDTTLEALIYTTVIDADGGKFEVPSVRMVPNHGEFLLLEGPVKVQIRIVEAGGEPYINVVAVRDD